jgi:mannose/fructose/N-acetylgalactosamine-specific phosphotransferase system component IIC
LNWILLTALGGIIGLDVTAFPQAMLSRPLIAGTLSGLVFGRPGAGLLVGLILEMFALVILPFGAARYPESGTAAAGAAAAYANVTESAVLEPRTLLLAVVFALAWEQVTGASMVFQRRINERLVANLANQPELDRVVERRHLLAMMLDFLRGCWSVLLGAIICTFLLMAFAPLFALTAGLSGRLLTLVAAAMLATAVPLLGGVRARWLSLGLGVLCGSLLLLR